MIELVGYNCGVLTRGIQPDVYESINRIFKGGKFTEQLARPGENQ